MMTNNPDTASRHSAEPVLYTTADLVDREFVQAAS